MVPCAYEFGLNPASKAGLLRGLSLFLVKPTFCSGLSLSLNANVGVAGAVGSDQLEQPAGIVGVEADAAVGGRTPQSLDGTGAMDCIATIEED